MGGDDGIFQYFPSRDDGIFQYLSTKDDGKYIEVFSVIQDFLMRFGCRKIISCPGDGIIRQQNLKIPKMRQDPDAISNISIPWMHLVL